MMDVIRVQAKPQTSHWRYEVTPKTGHKAWGSKFLKPAIAVCLLIPRETLILRLVYLPVLPNSVASEPYKMFARVTIQKTKNE